VTSPSDGQKEIEQPGMVTVILELGRLRKEDCEFKTSLSYIMGPCLVIEGNRRRS
jgi:hypothetical protein